MASHGNATAGRRAVVVGAGIVGVCTALYLRREGFAVTLIDRDEPGRACSFGNGANLGYASCVPLSLPGILWRAPRMLVDPAAPFKLRPGHALRALPWLLAFTRNSTRARVEYIADGRNALLRHMYDAYQPLLADAGAGDLVRRGGLLYVFESEAALAGADYVFDLRRRRGIEVKVLSEGETRELEPALGPLVKHGVLLPQVAQTTDPLALTTRLAEAFVRGGGTLERDEVGGFDLGSETVRAVLTSTSSQAADLVVIAAGAWSGRLAAMLGARVPLEAERGYHVMLPEPGVTMRQAVVSAERNVGITPLAGGIRVVGIAEFAGLDAPPDYRRADALLRLAQVVVPGLAADGASRWMGPRPSLPDSLPMIGPAPRFSNALFAFGHDHIGLACAAVTGLLIAELAAGRPPSVDLKPYRADRF